MRRFVVIALTVWTAACADLDKVATPPQQGLLDGELTFYRFDRKAFEAAEKSASFWAVRGQERSIALRYNDTGAEFMRFTVGAESLERRPDGSAFAAGDSIQISVRVDETGNVAFDFQPSGLRFSGSKPAILRIDATRAEDDIDGNGQVNLGDLLLALRSSVWKRELPGLPWLKLPAINLSGDIVQTNVHDFTGFGMATN